jgi:hypothetical protein
MVYIIAFVVLYVALAVIWVVSLVAYSKFGGELDFGDLGVFALKSAGLVAVATAVMLFVPFGGFIALAVWWLGLVVLFGMEVWEAKVLVAIIWALSFVLRFAVMLLLLRPAQG